MDNLRKLLAKLARKWFKQLNLRDAMSKDEEQKSKFTIAKADKISKISIDGDIAMEWWGLTYQDIKWAVADEKSSDVLEVDIFSDGGSVTDGVGMYRILLDAPNTVHTYVNAFAGSIATVVQMAGDKMFVADNAVIMIHSPMNVALMANAEDLRKNADILDKFETAMRAAYMRHFKGTEDELKTLLNDETYMTAQEFSDKFNNVTILSSGGAQAVAHRDPVAYLGSGELPEDKKPSFFSKAFAKSEGKPKKEREETDTMSITKEEMQDMLTAQATVLVSALKAAEVPAPEEEEPKEEEEVEVDVPFEGDETNQEDIQAHAEKVLIAKRKAKVDWNDANSVMAWGTFLASSKTKTKIPKTNTETTTVALGKQPAEAQVDNDYIARQVARLNGGK